MEFYQIKTALISVSDKEGLISFAQALSEQQVKLIASDGSAALLTEHDLNVSKVSSYTGFPEMLSGRVKTLHPKILAGILSRRTVDQIEMDAFDMPHIDLVVVNLYPFEKIACDPASTIEDVIEQIDIGGVTLLRAAAKNYKHVLVVVDPIDYPLVLEAILQHAVSEELRLSLAVKALRLIANYDLAIAEYFEKIQSNSSVFFDIVNTSFKKIFPLRYGENPHQLAAFYLDKGASQSGTIASSKQFQGKPLSYNNILDADAALTTVQQFSSPACVIVKHANPCGVALAQDLCQAYLNAFATDPLSAFGGVISVNGCIDEKLAVLIIQNQFVEVIIGASVSDTALDIFKQKSAIRVLTYDVTLSDSDHISLEYRSVSGGILIQTKDCVSDFDNTWKCVTQVKPTEQQINDLSFAWKVAARVKSNAVVFVKNGCTIGIGAGQPSRIDSTRIAIQKAKQAGLSLTNTVMASDAFFPFSDCLDLAIEAGISAVIQPGGSLRDQEIIKTANAANIAMIFTGVRHFRH